MDVTKILEKFEIKNNYRLVIAIFVPLGVLTMFFPPDFMSQTSLLKICIALIFVSMVTWQIDGYISLDWKAWKEQLLHRGSRKEYSDFLKKQAIYRQIIVSVHLVVVGLILLFLM